jgi:hypothetical protein
VVADAVAVAPKFPANREFRRIRLLGAILKAGEFCCKHLNFYSTEQGIFAKEQGILYARTGNLNGVKCSVISGWRFQKGQAEIDALLADFEDDVSDPADELDPSQLAGPEVTRPDDLWQLGKHRLLCGDARETSHLNRLMGSERAHMAFLDPPYNVRVRDIGGRGEVKHQEFAMASGEMSQSAFTSFLSDTLALAGSVSIDGALHFVCMDWRHIGELVEAGRVVYGAMLNLIAWVKSNASIAASTNSLACFASEAPLTSTPSSLAATAVHDPTFGNTPARSP